MRHARSLAGVHSALPATARAEPDLSGPHSFYSSHKCGPLLAQPATRLREARPCQQWWPEDGPDPHLAHRPTLALPHCVGGPSEGGEAGAAKRLSARMIALECGRRQTLTGMSCV